MVDWLCCGNCRISRSMVVNGYHHAKSQKSSPNLKAVITPDDLKQNTHNQTERRLSLFDQPRLSFPGFPRSSSRSVSMIRIAYPPETSSLELIEQNPGRSDFEISTLYSSGTGDNTQRNDQYVTYPRVSPKSISNISAFPPKLGVSTGTETLSNNMDVSAIYSSSTGDNSQRKERYVSYPRMSPNSTSNISAFPNTRGVSTGTETLSNNIEVSAIYSSSTGDNSQRKERYVSYPRMSPNSTSNFSTFSPTRAVSHRRISRSMSVMTELIEVP